MSKIILKNGREFEISRAERCPVLHDNVNREQITLYICPDLLGLDEAADIFENAENTKEFRITAAEPNGVSHEEIYYDYCLPVRISKATIGQDLNNGIEGSAMIIIQLAKKNHGEVQNDKILAALAAMGISI